MWSVKEIGNQRFPIMNHLVSLEISDTRWFMSHLMMLLFCVVKQNNSSFLIKQELQIPIALPAMESYVNFMKRSAIIALKLANA